MDWHLLADSFAAAWDPWLGREYGLELARNALHALTIGRTSGEHAVYESVIRAITHRRDVMREPAYASITDTLAATLASEAVHRYEVAAHDAASHARATHVLLGIACTRVSDSVWAGCDHAFALYLERRGVCDWRASIAYADRASETVASAAATAPETAAFFAFLRTPEARALAASARVDPGTDRADAEYAREHSAARLSGDAHGD